MDQKIVVLLGSKETYGQKIKAALEKQHQHVITIDQKEEASSQEDCYFVSSYLNEEERKNVLLDILKKYDHIDNFICNHFVEDDMDFQSQDKESLKKAYDENVLVAMLYSKAISEKMIEKQKGGHILLRSRDNAFQVQPGAFSTNVTSWSLRGMIRAMAKQLSKADIKVNTYCLGKESDEESVSALAAFLVSDLNVNITGQNIMVNDGDVMD